MKIYVKNNDISKALRVLKKKLNDEGDLKKLREQEHFVSKSQQARLDEKAGRKRWLKKRVMIEQKRVRAEQAAFNQSRRKKQAEQRNKHVA